VPLWLDVTALRNHEVPKWVLTWIGSGQHDSGSQRSAGSGYMRKELVTGSVTTMTLLLACSFGYRRLAASESSHRVHATILRRESSLHTSLSNQDVYLIQVIPKSGKVFTARMIDEYPSYANALPDSVLREGGSLSVALRRAPYCDEAPGQATSVDADSSVRCFAVVHGSWKFKGLVRDEWWK
jgi:hypothetical protein